MHSDETGDEETFGDLRRTGKGFRRSRKNDGSTKNKTGDEDRGMKNGPGVDRFGFGLEAWSYQGCCLLAGPLWLLLRGMVLPGGRGVPSSDRIWVRRITKKESSRRTASSTAVKIPLDRRFPDERGIETLDGIFRESTKKE